MFGLGVNIVTIACVLGGLCYLAVNYVFDYWKRRGIAQIQPSFPFGNLGPTLRQKMSAGDTFTDLYRRSKEHAVLGVYMSLRPALLINDPELVKNILVKDFQYFHDRGIHVNEERNPLSGHLFALSGLKWKNLRTTLTPTFTAGKLKAMFESFLNSGEVLHKFIEKHAQNEDTLEIRDILARYNTDIIASIAFGMECDSINNPQEPFREMGKKLFAQTFMNGIRMMMNMFMPKLNEYLHVKSVEDEIEKFMIGIVRDTLAYREKNNVVRKDFMQLLIQLRNSGKVSIDEKWDIGSVDGTSKTLTINEVAAQALIFFTAGFETSSTTMSFCLFELAKNPEIQRKVQMEIDEVKQRFDNKISYDSVMEMKYLEKCIDETMRKYPPVSILQRECTKPYKIPDMDFTIEKGTAIILPVSGLHSDPLFYPNPTQFIPERFDNDEINSKPYYPFGDGPRICIGLRMGKLQTKVGLALMLAKLTFKLGAGMPKELKMDPRLFIASSTVGINLKICNRQVGK